MNTFTYILIPISLLINACSIDSGQVYIYPQEPTVNDAGIDECNATECNLSCLRADPYECRNDMPNPGFAQCTSTCRACEPGHFEGCDFKADSYNVPVCTDDQKAALNKQCDALFSRDCKDMTPTDNEALCRSEADACHKVDCATAIIDCRYVGCQ